MSQENPMERICKTCEAQFDPTFANQLNCAECKLKKTVYKQAEREAVKIPDASDYVLPEAHAKHAAETLAKVKFELPDKKLTLDDVQVVEGIAETLLGLENSWSKKVTLGKDPTVQLLVGGHFCDAIASTAVERVHRAPHLLLSTTFAEMYRKFLPMVVDWASKNRQYASDDLMRDVREGLAGTYIPKPRYTPAAPPPDVPTFSTDEPSANILPRGRLRLTRQFDPHLSPEARRFLDGN
jgi:hypothetical protein